MRTMADVREWATRMQKLADMGDNFRPTSDYIIRNCPYKDRYFCDGTVNKTLERPACGDVEPCKYYRNGKCSLNLHTKRGN